MVKTLASLVLASRQGSHGFSPLPASGSHRKPYCTEARSSRVFFVATPILPQPRFSFPSRHSLVCHWKHFWFIFQGHSAPETWLHCTCSAWLSKCPWQTSQSLDSITFFFFSKQEILLPQLKKATAEYLFNTALVPKRASVNRTAPYYPSSEAGLMLSF